MDIQRHVPLAPMTTLRVGGSASYFTDVRTRDELIEAVRFGEEKSLPIVVIGGGSNMLIGDSGIDGLVLSVAFSDIVYEDGEHNQTRVHVGAGTVLDQLIRETVERGLWGLENLSHIPGTVGAVPIQNVGAYGVEAKDVIESVEVYDREVHEFRFLANAECGFDYRSSIFKSSGRDRYIITGVTFILSSVPRPLITYKDLARTFSDPQSVSQKDIRDAIIEIRSKKFPNWREVPTAGSFFKNPIIDEDVYALLKTQYPDLPGFPHKGQIKVSLGWILDHVLHLRGYREGSIGLYDAQALVLVTYGKVTAHDITVFSEHIIEKVYASTGIRIEREVVLIA